MPENHDNNRKRPRTNGTHELSDPVLSPSRPGSFDSLVKYYRSKGCVVNKVVEKHVPGTSSSAPVTLTYFPDLILLVGAGRGLFASEPIEEGEIILQINSDCLVNLDYPTLPPECKKYPPPFSP